MQVKQPKPLRAIGRHPSRFAIVRTADGHDWLIVGHRCKAWVPASRKINTTSKALKHALEHRSLWHFK